MTFKKLILFSLLLFLILIPLRIVFFKYQFLAPGLQNPLFWAIMSIVALALVRRFGIINYLEALFAIIVWILGGIFFDLLITSSYTGLSIFYKPYYWLGYFVMGWAIFIFHKKRHVHVRQELRAKHH